MSETQHNFEDLLEKIRQERTLGSARLCSLAAMSLAELVTGLDDISPEARLHEACGQVAQSRPEMAEMIRVGNDALLALSAGGAKGLQEWSTGYLERRHEMIEQIANTFADHLEGQVTVVTHSNSTVVRQLLKRVAARGMLKRVWCTLSDPPGEGRALAEHLVEAGVHVSLVSDAGVTRAVMDSDLIIVGADALQTLGVVNKVGTGILALLGLEHSRPIYSVSTTLKLLPPTLQRLYGEKDGSSEEVLSRDVHDRLLKKSLETGGSITIRNPYYERVEYDMFAAVVTEHGMLEPRDLPEMAKAVEVAEGFGW